jgi:uncharacterized membrane protein
VAERLLAIGEREQAHRHQSGCRLISLDEQALPQFYAGQRLAHWISFVLGLSYLGVMAFAVAKGYSLLGAGGAAFGIAAVVWSIRRASAGSAWSSEPGGSPSYHTELSDHDAAPRKAPVGS